MTINNPSSFRAAVKERHVSRQRRGNGMVKGGAGRNNWGREMDDVADVQVPYEEPFYDDEIDIEEMKNGDDLREDPRVSAQAL